MLSAHGLQTKEACVLLRGMMPSFWMLANGVREAGVSIYLVNEKIDAGEPRGPTSIGD